MTDSRSTKEKIMDAAEVCFGNQGITETSVRKIVKAADVNLGAVNYHFGSKENLVAEVLIRRLDPVMEKRAQRYTQLKASAGDRPLTLRELIDLYARPQMELLQEHPEFVLFLMRVRVYADISLQKQMEERFEKGITELHDAIRATLPPMSDAEFQMRLFLSVGLMHMNPMADKQVKCRLVPLDDKLDIFEIVVSYIVGGMTAVLKG